MGKIKNESLFIGGKSKNCVFLHLIEGWISSALVGKYLLKELPILVIGFAKVELLSMMASDVWFQRFSEMFFIPFQVFFKSVICSRKNLLKQDCLLHVSVNMRFLYFFYLFSATVLICGSFSLIYFVRVIFNGH